MKKFLWGLVIGVLVAFPLGMNYGKGKALLSNPFADKPLGEQMKDTAQRAVEETKKKAKEVVEESKRVIHEKTEPESAPSDEGAN